MPSRNNNGNAKGKPTSESNRKTFSKSGMKKSKINDCRDLYDGCKITKDVMLDISKKIGVKPEDLFEELYYQLPLEWIRSLRNKLYRKMALEIKNGNIYDYLTESDGSYSSDLSSVSS